MIIVVMVSSCYFCVMNLESGSSIFPLAVLPPISWLAVASLFTHIKLEVKETYPKQTIRNHYYIATANGTLKCSIPVTKSNGNKTRTEEVFTGNEPWSRVHLRAIESAYSNSAYFIHYIDELRALFPVNQVISLVDLALRSNQFFVKKFKLNLEIGTTEDWRPYSESFDLRKFLVIPELTVPISGLSENVEHPPAGIKNDIVSTFAKSIADFTHEPITLRYPAYFQNFSEKYGFVGNLSVLDILFNLGPESRDYIIQLGRQFDEIITTKLTG